MGGVEERLVLTSSTVFMGAVKKAGGFFQTTEFANLDLLGGIT
jgi:hypothetical protein